MTIEKLKALHRARPFRPFVIHTADGASFRVDHPEFLAQSPTGRTVTLELGDGSSQHIDLLLVTRLAEHQPKSSNGKKRR
jgi:hypothetical protein